MTANTGHGAQVWQRQTWSWAALGWASGALGALIVALFFLVIDLIGGRPFWTPAALGSALFLGERLPPQATPVPVLVVAYTGVHLGVFASFGLITASLLDARLRRLGLAGLLAIALGLFVAFEASFALFAWLFAPSLVGDIGAWRVASANALAALAMAAFLAALSGRLRHDSR